MGATKIEIIFVIRHSVLYQVGGGVDVESRYPQLWGNGKRYLVRLLGYIRDIMLK